MSKHTPGPWKVRGRFNVHSGSLHLLQAAGAGTINETDEANAARIVACVNACAGINPEAVPELLVALKDLAYRLRIDGRTPDGITKEHAALKCEAAIAKADPVEYWNYPTGSEEEE